MSSGFYACVTPEPKAPPVVPALHDAPADDVMALAQMIISTLTRKQIKQLGDLVSTMLRVTHIEG